MITVSIGIMAYNEAANIGRLLDRLQNQKLKKINIKEIIVVASGCTDRTIEIVKEKKNRKIRLIIEKNRRGKARAINLFLNHAKSRVLIMISADVLPGFHSVEDLTAPFHDPSVGMTAGHIIPVNEPDGFVRFYVITLWKLHHEVASRKFKAGEMIAWRNIIASICPDTAVDETNIEALIEKKGLASVYVPSAYVYNRGPETFSDFFKVRRRQLAAYFHMHEDRSLRYKPATMDNWMVIKLFIALARPRILREYVYLPGVLFLEALARVVAWYDWNVCHRHYPIWPVAATTKTLPKHLPDERHV